MKVVLCPSNSNIFYSSVPAYIVIIFTFYFKFVANIHYIELECALHT